MWALAVVGPAHHLRKRVLADNVVVVQIPVEPRNVHGCGRDVAAGPAVEAAVVDQVLDHHRPLNHLWGVLVQTTRRLRAPRVER